MTYAKLRELILEGAPTKDQKRLARKAMKHYSYTSYSFRITNHFRERKIEDKDAEMYIVDMSISFYQADLPRFITTGTFDRFVPRQLKDREIGFGEGDMEGIQF